MDTNVLVTRLGVVFNALQNDGVAVECAALAPAYPDLVSSPYILMVAAPALQSLSCGPKIKTVSRKLFAILSHEELQMIDRVRVYNSKKELIADTEYDPFNVNYCEETLKLAEQHA